MSGFARLACAAGCGAALLASCATSAVRERTGIVMSAYARERECFQVRRGERIDYRFRSSTPVAFALLSQDGPAEIASISADQVTEDARIFAPALPREYCLSWEAGAAGATLDYMMTLRPPP